VKSKLIALLGFISAIFAALFYRERANYKEAQLEGEKAAREVEQKDIKATVEGLQNEAKVINNDVDADHFS